MEGITVYYLEVRDFSSLLLPSHMYGSLASVGPAVETSDFRGGTDFEAVR